MALELDPQTGLLSADPAFHDATAGELHEVFVQPYPQLNRRHNIWTSYLAHCRDVGQLFQSTSLEQWLNGSFTTAKQDPDDLDFTTFLDLDELKALSVQQRQAAGALFRGPGTEPDGLLDSYAVTVEKDSSGQEVEATRKMRDYWRRWFGRDRDGTPKGIARTTVGGAT